MMMKRLVVFTKMYPYGLRETYVDTELPYLKEEFTDVCFVPYDHYGYRDEDNRLQPEWTHARALEINALTPNQPHRIWKRELRIVRMWLNEIVVGRDKWRHIRHGRLCLRRLRHAYTQSTVLAEIARNEGWTAENTLLYNYWLHYGAIIGIFLREHMGVQFQMISRAHALDMFHKDWPYPGHFLPFETAKIKACDHVYAASDHGRRFFQCTFPKWADKFRLQVLGVFDKGERDSVPSEVFTLCSATSISEMKRLHLVPELMARLSFPVRWIHYGTGRDAPIALMQETVTKHGLEDVVEFRGLRPHNEVMHTYKHEHVDLYLNVSSGETIPVAVMEPASFGIPVMATACFGTPELVDDTIGALIPVDFDLDEVAAIIAAFQADPERLLQLGKQARARVMTDFNADTNLRCWTRLLSSYLPTQPEHQ